MNLQTLFNSQLGVAFALGLGRTIPPRVGYPLADRIARVVASQRGAGIVRAVRANQWVVSECRLSSTELDEITTATFRHNARCLYDLYRNESNPEGMRRLVPLSPEFERLVARAVQDKTGLLMVCPHLSNFDLVGRVIGLSGIDVQILSYPQPSGGYRWQNEMRRKYGLELTPMSLPALRQATERLHAGGLVLTGVDRPLHDANYQPAFFGRPAALPAFHVRLALKTGVPVAVVTSQTLPDGSYTIRTSEPFLLQPHPDLQTEIVQNQEAILRVIETWIREAPEQWAMFYPVWPEALTEMP